MKKKLDRNFVVKVINQYADNYKILEDENLNLKNEIEDMKSNLNINKGIIESFFKSGENNQDSYLSYLNQLKIEIKSIEEKNEKLLKEKKELHERIIRYDNTMNEFLLKKTDKSRELKNRIFLLENLIIKKNSVIENLKRKYLNLQETKEFEDEKEPRELYISDPNENLLILYNDLNLYKEAYENTLKKVKNYKKEIESLKDKLREKKGNNNTIFTTKLIDDIIQKQTRKNWETDEWFAVLNYLNLTSIDIETNSHSNKFISKLLDAIELINRILIKRNNRINELEKELEKLKEKNKDLSKDNISLLKNVFSLKGFNGNFKNDNKKISKINRTSGQYINTNISMINNISMENITNEKLTNLLLKDFVLENKNNYNNQSMEIDNSFNIFKDQSSNTNYSNLSSGHIQKHINLTQSSENSEIENDVIKNLNNNHLIKKVVKNSENNNIINKKIKKGNYKNLIKNINLDN